MLLEDSTRNLAPCRQWPYAISAVLYVPLLRGRIFSGEGSAWHQASLDAGIKQVLRVATVRCPLTSTPMLAVISVLFLGSAMIKLRQQYVMRSCPSTCACLIGEVQSILRTHAMLSSDSCSM